MNDDDDDDDDDDETKRFSDFSETLSSYRPEYINFPNFRVSGKSGKFSDFSEKTFLCRMFQFM